MQTARMDLKLSQKDVAQKINEKPSVLQDYESGKAIPNPQILGKLERALGVKLRGMCAQDDSYSALLTTPSSQAPGLGKNWEGPRSHDLVLSHPFV